MSRSVPWLSIAFLAWFTMKFHMDNANDSETQAYVGGVLWNLEHGTLAVDATGHYAALAAYVLWPFTTAVNLVAGAPEIRGLALTLLFSSAALYGLAYAWYRRLGFGWLTSLLGLVLVSISTTFALSTRGWELDKRIEPVLFLLAALAAYNRRWTAFVVVAALAAANRETGVLMPLLALGALMDQRRTLLSALRSWPLWLSLALCATEVLWLRAQLPPVRLAPFEDLTLDHLVYVAGGMCLLPVFAVLWLPSSTWPLRRLFVLLAPLWLVFVLATDHLEQGAALLAPVALACVPITLGGLEGVLRPSARARRAPAVDVPTPAAPVERERSSAARGT